jgi:hypothetical protein
MIPSHTYWEKAMSERIMQFVAIPAPINVQYRDREDPQETRGRVVQVSIIGMGLINTKWRPVYLDGACELSAIPKGADIDNMHVAAPPPCPTCS